MALKISKTSWGYIIPTLLLIGGVLFLYFHNKGSSSETASSDYKTHGYFNGGTASSDLNVKSVRWHTHPGYERIVFDINKYDGVLTQHTFIATNETGLYQIGIEEEGASYLDGELSGFRSFDGHTPSFKKSEIISNMQIFPNGDDSYLFRLKLTRPAAYKVFTLKHPTRLVIDLQ